MRRQVVLLLMSTVVLGFHAQAKAGDTEELTWGELSSLNGRMIRVAMPEAAVITGKLTAVQPEGLILQIQKTDKQNGLSQRTIRSPTLSSENS